jgi:hypothetical protein
MMLIRFGVVLFVLDSVSVPIKFVDIGLITDGKSPVTDVLSRITKFTLTGVPAESLCYP